MRHTLIVAACAAITATSVSFAVAQATNQPMARPAATDKAAVSQLRKLNANVKGTNRRLDELDRKIGRSQTGTVRGLLTAICRAQSSSALACDL